MSPSNFLTFNAHSSTGVILRLLILGLSLVMSRDLQAQSTFQMMYGSSEAEKFFSLAEVPDSGFVTLGRTPTKILLVRTDANGGILWQKTYGDSSRYFAYQVVYLPGTGFMMFGRSFYFNNFPNGFLMLVDLNGNLVWTKWLPTLSPSGFTSLAATSDSGVVAGFSNAFNGSLIKISAAGAIQWNRLFYISPLGNAYISSVTQTSDGGYVLAGLNYPSPSSLLKEILVIRCNALGDTLWTRNLGIIQPIQRVGAIKETPDSGFIIASNTDFIQGIGSQFYLIKLDSSGNVMWSKADNGSDSKIICDVIVTPSGYTFLGYLRVAGTAYYTPVLFGTDTSGNMLWQNSYNIAANFESTMKILTTSDGYQVFVSETQTGPFGLQDAVLIKTDFGGNATCSNPSIITLNSVSITPGNLPSPYISSSLISFNSVPMTVGNAGLSSQPACLTGIGETDETGITVSPNPFHETITVTLPTTVEKAEAVITNLAGQTVYREVLSAGNQFTLLPPPLPAGMYVIEIFSDSQMMHRGKVVKE